jgi:antitoxin component YwqK of YwqJK toxin-antitoxin module
MKRIVPYLILLLLCSTSLYAQKLTLTDLTALCSKKNWEDVNQSLLIKKWEYYDSKKGDNYKYSTITWSYSKEYYNDAAQGWFYLYTFEGFPNKISYSVFNKESYTTIQNSISSAGFKLINSEIEDNEIISTYSNTNYTLEISTEKREKSDNSWENQSITAYNITLIKKTGIYDPENGKKTDSYYDGTIKSEYSLVNGKLNGFFKDYFENGNLKKSGNFVDGIENGLFKEYGEHGILEAEYGMSKGELNGSLKTYYSDGKLKKSGSYLNGKEHGNFVEYDEYGNKDAEYVMSNDLNNGILKIYENGKFSYSTSFLNDTRNGQYMEYYYNDENGLLNFKLIGNYLNDEKNGLWKFIYINEGKERILTVENFTNGIKNGDFQEIRNDSLIIGTYRNNEIHGKYKVFCDLNKVLFGGVIETDISKVTLISEGNYNEGLKSGYWKNYDLTGTLINEGRYSNDEKTGEWKYYHPSVEDSIGNKLPYSKQLFLIENYSNGELDGLSKRYSYLEFLEYPCSELDENKNPLDSCSRLEYQKFLETSYYKNGKLNGPFELKDSIGGVIAQGVFKDDVKVGEWLYRYSEKDINDNLYFIYQKGKYSNDKRDGKWIQYYTEGQITETFNYKNGDLHGEWVSLNKFNKPRETKQFSIGKLTELIIYDSLGINPLAKYEIYEEKQSSYKCVKTNYSIDGYTSQEYWINKENEIDPDFFEFQIEMSIDNNFNSGKSYKDGWFKLFNSNNQPLISGNFLKEDRIGLWIFYYYNQNVKIVTNYAKNISAVEKYLNLKDEMFTGTFLYFDIENGIKEERKIKEGLRNGKTTYIDTKTNKTIKKEQYKNGILK